MQKHKFGVTCPDKHFVTSASCPHEHENYWVNVSRPKCTKIDYVAHRSHQMQEHNFDVMCPNTLFVGSAPGAQVHEKYCIHVSRPGHTGMHYVA
jgi:hypothetical protein